VSGAGDSGRHGRIGAGAGLAFVLAVLILASAIRLRLADTPLERDEGEYAYAGQLILDGVPPYRLACNMKFPGTYYSYALIMAVFGETSRGIRIGLILVNAASALLLFAIGRRLLGTLGGTVAAACYAVYSLDISLMGLFAHATHFVLLPVLGGILLLVRGEAPPRRLALLVSGALLGLGVLMKQHAAAYVLLAPALVLWRGRRGAVTRLAILAAGAALPMAVLVAVLTAGGVLGRFWFWTFRYAAEYVSQQTARDAIAQLSLNVRLVGSQTLPFWIAAAAGLVLSFALRPARPGARIVPVGLLVASLAAICPGFYFREHYFILLLPPAALLVGTTAAVLDRLAARFLPRRLAPVPAAAGLLALLGAFLFAQHEALFLLSPRDLSRLRYGVNPFIEMETIGRALRERMRPGERLVVFGSEPEVYFYADRRSATGTLYMYPLMEAQAYASRMQQELIADVEEARPEYLIYVTVPYSWGVVPRSDRRIFGWVEPYIRRYYRVVGIAEILSPRETRYAWDDEARSYRPRSDQLVRVFRRR
jgi:hypothetical protein